MGEHASKKHLKKMKTTTPQPDPPPEKTARYVCYRCGMGYSTQRGNFPVSHSHMYRGYGYLPWCYDCIDDMYDYYVNKLGDKREALKRMCMKMDLYFNEKTFNLVVRTAGQKTWLRTYIQKVNTINNIDRTYDNTLQDEAQAAKEAEAAREAEEAAMQVDAPETPLPSEAEATEEVVEEEEEEVPDEIVRFWGAGHDASVYRDLEIRMADWKTKYPEDYEFDGAEIALLKQACNLEVTIARDMSAGKSIEKSVNALNTVLGSLNIKPVQKKEELSEDILNMPLGVGIQKWEETLPLPKVPEELIDQNDIIRNIHTWFFGHTCKMCGVKNSYTKMYEDAIAKFKVEKPEYQDEDDDTIITDILLNGDDPDGSK